MATVLTADDWLNQMIVQARLLDPDGSFATGTPEYKIFSSVAQTLASSQVDMTGLTNALNIDSKVGSQLDQFISNFGMQRQTSTAGQGYVVFTRPSAAPSNITIAQGTVIQANGVNTNSPTTVQYSTSAAGTIAQGETASSPVPVQAITTGVATNIPAGALNQFVGTIPAGVSAVSNPTAINNGSDPEDDDIFKTRFQNTWARNLSGTTSSYLAVALAGAFSTKAVCIGQQSTYIEYIQIPDGDDTGQTGNGGYYAYTPEPAIWMRTAGSGSTGLWTTALSDIPYAKNLFTTVPTFISDNGSGTYYYQQGVDYIYNAPPLIQGDALREVVTTSVNSTTISNSSFTLPVDWATGFSSSGTLYLIASDGNFYHVTYTGISDSPSIDPDAPQFTGCQVVETVGTGITTQPSYPIYQVPTNTNNRPNFTFTNVNTIIDSATGQYSTLFDATTGEWVADSATVDPDDTLVTVQTLVPGQVVQSEFRYVSTASRNNIAANLTNCIDVYVNSSNPQQTSCVFMPPSASTNPLTAIFSSSSSSPFYIENFRRDGEPQRRPNIGNYWTPLFNPPIVSLPSTITGPDGATFFLGVHYWLVHETDTLVNSVRGRDGIEWSYQFWGDNQTTAPAPNAAYLPAGQTTSTIMNYGQSKLPVEVDNYSNDANIINMQATYDAQSPATTDVLAHGAKMRYFKFDVTLMYTQNAGSAAIQSAITSTLSNYLNNQYFGSIIQLSSVLEQIASVSGVQNVRWSNDLPTPPNQIRVIETDVNGNPLAGAHAGRYAPYSSSANGSFTFQITGKNFGVNDYFYLAWNDSNIIAQQGAGIFSYPIYYSYNISQIQTAINSGLALMSHDIFGFLLSAITSTSQTTFLANWDTTYIGSVITIGSEKMLVTGLSAQNTGTVTVVRGYEGTTPSTYANGTNFTSTYQPYYGGATVTTLYTSTDVNNPYTQYLVTYNTAFGSGVNQPSCPVVTNNNITQGTYLYNEDFFLMDDELPSLPTGQVSGDTLPGLIARTRAENTFFRAGLG